MSRSILAHVIPKITQAEPAATRALHYLLDASDKVAERFVDLVGSEPFDIGRIGSEWIYAKGVRPDLAIHDAGTGDVRVFVENKFRAWLTDFQPVEYLNALPPRETSVLAFIAPEDRIDELWGGLTARCRGADFHLSEESTTADLCRIRVARIEQNHARRLVLTSWRRVLEALQHAAATGGEATLEQDIVQLRGLTEEMRWEASEAAPPDAPAGVSFAGSEETFLPLRADEPTDAGAAGRLLDYCGLIDEVTRRLVADPSWDTKGMRASGFGRYLRVHERFALLICMAPLWCTCLGVEGREREVQALHASVDDEGEHSASGDRRRTRTCDRPRGGSDARDCGPFAEGPSGRRVTASAAKGENRNIRCPPGNAPLMNAGGQRPLRGRPPGPRDANPNLPGAASRTAARSSGAGTTAGRYPV